MGGTFEEMFDTRFPPRRKKVKSLRELIYQFEDWTKKPTTLRQKLALEEQFSKLGIRDYGK